MPKLLYAPERSNSITCNGDGHTTSLQPWNYWQLTDAGSRKDNFLFSLVSWPPFSGRPCIQENLSSANLPWRLFLEGHQSWVGREGGMVLARVEYNQNTLYVPQKPTWNKLGYWTNFHLLHLCSYSSSINSLHKMEMLLLVNSFLQNLFTYIHNHLCNDYTSSQS